jgi:multiple sugar transport system ATP-binding protein
MATLSIEKISKRFGNTQVLHEINLDLADGEFLVLVGPSGCGKSTLMNIVAGLEEPTTGKLQLAGRDITHLEPDERDVAMVFQSYALYPNMTVAQNIAFPLEMRKVPKAERDKAVADVAQMLQIGHLLDRKPRQLSGGQRQRVAIGRALARSPSLFLFDEPLSNLDAKLRVDMRAELKKLHMSTGVTTIYVTHDQVEAMTLGTRIAVLKDGLIQQLATPMELYNRPANLFVAGFIGSPAINLADGAVDAHGVVRMAGVDTGVRLPQHAGQQVTVGVRPEDMLVQADASANSLAAKVTLVEPTGAESYVLVGGAFGEFTLRSAGEATYSPGAPLHLGFSADKVHVFDAAGGQRLN